MYAIALIRYRRPIEEVVAQQDAHRAYLRGLKDRGTLVASGPLDPRYGGALLLHLPDTATEADLDAIRDGDPYYQAGVAQYELLRWNVVTGKADLDRARTTTGRVEADATPPLDGEVAVVRNFESAIEAELARSALEAAGIYAAVWDEDSQLGPVAQGVRLVVPEASLPKALAILEASATVEGPESKA